MDIKLPQMDGIETTRRIKAISPQSRVVMLTIYEASDYQAAASAALPQLLLPYSGYCWRASSPDRCADWPRVPRRSAGVDTAFGF